MKKWIVVSSFLVSLMVGGLVHAQVDNMMGVYFDEAGTVSCVEEVEVLEMFDVYLVLHNPTMAAIDGFSCHVQAEIPAIFLQEQYCSYNALNVCDPPGHICVGFGEPVPTIGTTWLVHWTMLLLEDETVGFTLEGGMSSPDPLLPAILVGEDLILATVDPGVGGGHVARIGDCTVTTEPRAFDFLKALYR